MEDEVEFRMFPKIPRLNRNMVITEKIDGTNGCIVILDDGSVMAQSRNRFVTSSADNQGFAKWVEANKEKLVELLGPGYHYGEWWGSGIQCGYGLTKGEKFFSLFNDARWSGIDFSAVPGLGVVPVLWRGPFDTAKIASTLTLLGAMGSIAMPGYPKPEGIVIWHEHARQLFKVTLDNDEVPKSLVRG